MDGTGRYAGGKFSVKGVFEKMKKKRYKLIACEIMFREACDAASRCKNIVDVSFLPKGLHDIGTANMFARLQKEIDEVEHEKYDAILLGYALCNNGVVGLRSPIPFVIPKAHDCITLFMGSKERYREYFDANPGAFYYTSGWIERNEVDIEMPEGAFYSQMNTGMSYNELVELYGEDNAEFLKETLWNLTPNYTKATFINTGIGMVDENRKTTKEYAAEKNWDFEEVKGDTSLIFKLLNGDWDDCDFLVIPPGKTIAPSYQDDIVIATSS